MESSGSSFIPQRPTRGKVAAKSFRKVYVLSYVSYLVFFTTLLAVGGIFVYQLTLKSELSSLQQELVAQKNLFSQSDLDRVRNLDYRIDAASQLVNNHASLLTIFNALDNVIADPLQFLTFDYDRKEDVRRPRLSLSAVAAEFDEVIFQDGILRNNAITSRFGIANVNLSTQPIDQERLELGVQQVVSINLAAELSVSDINFTGFVSTPQGDDVFANSDDFDGDVIVEENQTDDTDLTDDALNSDSNIQTIDANTNAGVSENDVNSDGGGVDEIPASNPDASAF